MESESSSCLFTLDPEGPRLEEKSPQTLSRPSPPAALEAEVAALDALRSGLGVGCVGALAVEAGGVHVSLALEDDTTHDLLLVLDDPELYPSCSGRFEAFACADPALSGRLASLNATLGASQTCRVGAALVSLGRALDLDLEWADVLSQGGSALCAAAVGCGGQLLAVEVSAGGGGVDRFPERALQACRRSAPPRSRPAARRRRKRGSRCRCRPRLARGRWS